MDRMRPRNASTPRIRHVLAFRGLIRSMPREARSQPTTALFGIASAASALGALGDKTTANDVGTCPRTQRNAIHFRKTDSEDSDGERTSTGVDLRHRRSAGAHRIAPP